MKSVNNTATRVWGLVFATALIHAAGRADGQTASAITSTNTPAASDTRYGLFNWLDHRSQYGQGAFPEPFLADDSDLEVNELRLDWLHTSAGSDRSDVVTAEIEKGFGPLTLEIEIPYERDASPDGIEHGIANIDLGARCPFYQYVSANDFFDNTMGLAVEVGVPVNTAVSKNAELVPKFFDDLRLGEHLTFESILGYSTLFGPGDDGGLQTFEYGLDFGYTITRHQLPVPGVQQLIPMFELNGETELNKDNPGQNSVLGILALRADLKPIGGVQPRLGAGYVFPMNNNARAHVHSGVYVSLVFEY